MTVATVVERAKRFLYSTVGDRMAAGVDAEDVIADLLTTVETLQDQRVTQAKRWHTEHDRATAAEAQMEALRDQRDTAVGALREIEADDLYLLTLGGLGQFRANTLATARRVLAAADRPPTGTPDTGTGESAGAAIPTGSPCVECGATDDACAALPTDTACCLICCHAGLDDGTPDTGDDT
jgi:hypothetical protein